MGNAAAGGLEQEAAEGREARNSVGAVSAMSDPTLSLQKKQSSPPKLPMPPEEELEERFNVVLKLNEGQEETEFRPDEKTFC
ncbi:hypothetical protein AMECASPLE_026888 [Ameca splendens]|uniref:Uncharacterized protein n=1 Tax=Ameca splendens TaxID=208324 RepID=A0ABV0YS21_9TELE